MMSTYAKRYAAIALLLVVSGIIVIWLRYHQVNGYEASIYAKTGPLFWSLVIVLCSLGVIAILNGIAFNHRSMLQVGSLFVIMASSFVISLPTLRGYILFGSGDVETHIGYSIDIVKAARISNADFYPVTHLLEAIIHQITGVGLVALYRWTPLAVDLFGWFIVGIIVRNFTEDNRMFFVGIAVAAVFIIGANNFMTTVLPDGISVSYELFIFMLFLMYVDRGRGVGLGVSVLISTIMVSYFHPLTAVSLIMVLIFTPFYYNTHKNHGGVKCSYIPAVTLLVIFISWIAHSYLFGGTIKDIANLILRSGQNSSSAQMVAQASKLSVGLVGILKLGVEMYGLGLALIVFGFFGLLWARKLGMNRNYRPFFIIVIMIYICFALLLLVMSIGFNSDRMLDYLASASLVPAAIMFGRLFLSEGKIIRILGVTVLLASFAFSVAFLYPSPERYEPNLQVSADKLAGVGFLLHAANKNSRIAIMPSDQVFRDVDMVEGRKKELSSVLSQFGDHGVVPDHFAFSTFYNTPYRFIVPVFLSDKIAYTSTWKMVHRFTRYDFDRVAREKGVSLIYENNGSDIFVVGSP